MIFDENGNINKADSILKRVRFFNRTLNNYKYGIPYKGDIVIDTPEFYNEHYKLLSPDEFVKYKGGCCWDYVAYESAYFAKEFPMLKTKTIYIIFDDGLNYPTHTFLIFLYKNKWYYFESSYKNIAGVHTFGSERTLISFVAEYMKNDLLNGTNINPYICEYNALDKKTYGMTCQEFMNYCCFNGKEILI